MKQCEANCLYFDENQDLEIVLKVDVLLHLTRQRDSYANVVILSTRDIFFYM